MPESFLSALAKPQPDPGGGAAAAQGVLIGLALIIKILLLEKARIKKEAPASRTWRIKESALKTLFSKMKDVRERDRKIYPQLVQARRLQAETPDLNRIIDESITVPLEMMKTILKGLPLIAWVGKRCRKTLQADLLVAGDLITGGLYGAFHIGSSNLPLIKENRKKQAVHQRLVLNLRKGEEAWRRIKINLST